MAPGPALGARHPPDPVETNIDPVSLFGGWPTLAISSGARRARALLVSFRGDVGRSRDSKARARPARLLHRVVVRRLADWAEGRNPHARHLLGIQQGGYTRTSWLESVVIPRLRRLHRAWQVCVQPSPASRAWDPGGTRSDPVREAPAV